MRMAGFSTEAGDFSVGDEVAFTGRVGTIWMKDGAVYQRRLFATHNGTHATPHKQNSTIRYGCDILHPSTVQLTPLNEVLFQPDIGVQP